MAAPCLANTSPRLRPGVKDAPQFAGRSDFPVVDVAVTLKDGSYHSGQFLRHGVPRGCQDRHRGGLAEGVA